MSEDRSKQPQHLTSIDLDVSGIIESLRVANEAIEKGSIEAGKIWNENIGKTIKENSDAIFAPFQENPALKTTTEQIKSIEREYSNLSRAAVTANKKGVIKQAITLNESDGSKTVKQFRKINGVLQETTRTQTLNASKLKADNDRNIRQLDSLIEKQQKFNSTVAKQKSSSENKRLLQESNDLISRMKETRAELDKQGAAFVEDGKKVYNYRAEVKKLSADYERTGTKGESFLKQIGDKARWLSAFYIVNELKNGFVESIQVIKETEDAVVNLQRVLNNDALSNNQISDQLYDTAYQYGRSFEEVSEVATRWAQAGYEWNEVIELTSGTMLALNTAELDVTQSTQGLIAIMRQWGFEVEDYDEVINKINITADNFAVTSETIVDALQRAGSSTKAANMSFEETIGVITALSEATGRSGEHIGVALNALAQYTSKSKSLETFAQIGSDAMKQLVDDYNKGAASIYDIWMQLSKELESLSEQQAQALLGGADFDELATELQSALQDAYGTAGTYRRTDFIALLNDIGKAEEAINNMSDAVGYSEKENEKYMKTLTANFEQLKVALRELAVQAGEGTFGILNIAKGLTNFATALAKVTKNLGGVIPLLTAMAGIFMRIKAANVAGAASSIFKSVNSGIDTIRLFGMEIVSIAKKEGVATAATWGFKTAVGSLTGAIGLGISAFVLIKGAIDSYNEKQAEARRNTISASQETMEQANNLIDLTNKYIELSKSQTSLVDKEQEYKSLNEEITESLGERSKKLNGLKVGSEEYLSVLKDINSEEKQRLATASQQALQAAGEQFDIFIKKSQRTAWGITDRIFESRFDFEPTEIKEAVEETLATFRQFDIATQEYVYMPLNNTKEAISEYGLAMIALKDKMDVAAGASEEAFDSITGSNFYQQVAFIVEQLEDSENGFQTFADNLVRAKLLLSDIETPQSFSDLDEIIPQIAEKLGWTTEQGITFLRNFAIEFYGLKESSDEAKSSLSSMAETVAVDMEALGKSIEMLNAETDNFQSALGTMRSAIEEFNKNGALSIDTIQALAGVNSEYLQALNITANGISWNKEALDGLIASQKESALEAINQAEAEAILEMTANMLGQTTEDLSDEEKAAKENAEKLKTAIHNLNAELADGTADLLAYADGMAKLVNPEASVDDFDFDKWKANYDKIHGAFEGIRGALSSSGDDFNNWSSTASGATQNVKREIDVLKDSINELSSSIDEAQSGVNTMFDAMSEYNEQGYLSIDTIQKIVQAGGEYLQLLDFTSQGIQINKNALDNLLGSQQANINAMIQQGYAADVCRIAEQYLGVQLSQASVEAANANVSLASMNPTLANLTNNAWASTQAANGLASALANLYGKSLSAGKMANFQRDLDASRKRWQGLLSQANKSIKNVGAFSSSANKYHENQAKKASDAEKKRLESQKKALEAQKKAIKERYDAEIAALRKVEKENDRIRRKEEYYRNRQEALKDIERAEARSGIEYREQESEARQKLADLDREWKETLEDWSIEDKIAELEALRDAEIAAIDAQIDAISEKISNLSSSMVSSVSDASGAMFDSYGGDFVDPAVDYTEESADGLNNDLLNNYDSQFLDLMLNNTLNTSQVMNNGLANDFSNTNNQMLSIGSSSASKLFSIYDKDFFQPMKCSISELANELKSLDTSKLQPATFQSIANLQRVSAPTIKNTSNNVVNNSTNYSRSNTYANVYNSGGYGASSSVNDYLKRLYRKP